MKSIQILCALLLTLAVANASFVCPKPCGANDICVMIDNNCKVLPWWSCQEVTMAVKMIGQWNDSVNNCVYSQWEVTVTNHLPRKITNLFIATDDSLTLRDSASIWNIAKNGNVLSLPAYQPSVNPSASYTFGFIIKGTHQPHMIIKAVTY
ncbi:hypothetical protein CYY_002172 [Polysphondylium violaceum]|uniref:Carbohydrate binding domain-containing protein n=2 Tax=Polysphondylium violaceum TaxID=133409 RepID=A0A8J4PZJ5_9MYCE|nr:hypothetical protein CYY_002172 [Polysphondylium violaceum]